MGGGSSSSSSSSGRDTNFSLERAPGAGCTEACFVQLNAALQHVSSRHQQYIFRHSWQVCASTPALEQSSALSQAWLPLLVGQAFSEWFQAAGTYSCPCCLRLAHRVQGVADTPVCWAASQHSCCAVTLLVEILELAWVLVAGQVS